MITIKKKQILTASPEERDHDLHLLDESSRRMRPFWNALTMLCPRGDKRIGWDFDQKQKFGVKLPAPWGKISIQSSPSLGKVLSSKLPTRPRISSHLKQRIRACIWLFHWSCRFSKGSERLCLCKIFILIKPEKKKALIWNPQNHPNQPRYLWIIVSSSISKACFRISWRELNQPILPSELTIIVNF